MVLRLLENVDGNFRTFGLGGVLSFVKGKFVCVHNTEKCRRGRGVYMDADKFLALPGRKQARVTEYFEFHISYL